MRAERWDAGPSGAVPSPRSGSGSPRNRPPARDRQYGERHPADRGYGERQPAPRPPQRRPGDERTSRPAPQRRGAESSGQPRPAASRSGATQPATGSKLRGAVAVLGVFLLTLAAAALDSYTGVGLGMITTVVLALASLAGTALVRRSDLLTMVVAPPLVFVGVAVVNIALAPSATLSLPTLATLLIRGFPAMAIGVAIALAVGLVRLATRR
ncbi:DUF6542 domain-containing protein [Modestobacter sp. NPDC049651]|uniref:DUF6542 domain-containing protein n=1 Tax=unclassified Modestobacter TaxID=2643866 RepID=UPI00340988EC